MDIPSVIRRRLKELRIDQRDLAVAADVTESYVSQLLSRKKAPPAPDRTDIYRKMEKFLQLPSGELSKLANLHRQRELKKKVEGPPRPLYGEFRELILRKCEPGEGGRLRATFESEPFGEIERFVTQKLLNVAQRIAKQELENEDWLRSMAHLADRSYEQMRVSILEFLDTDVLGVSAENCVAFLEPLIESWTIDLETFGMEIVLNRRLVPDPLRRFEFRETEPEQTSEVPAGLRDLLADASLGGDATDEEIEFLKGLKFRGRQPNALYYYRELQNLRDPIHFDALGGEVDRLLGKNGFRTKRATTHRSRKSGSTNRKRGNAI
jgi:transcriptional regulator with XRE-family HTH domain